MVFSFSMYKNKPLWWWIATWFGSGMSPIVSGTVGSAAALPFAFIIQYYFGNAALFAASLLIFAIGCWAAREYMRHVGGAHDPGQIVVDEVAGQWLLLAVLFPTWQSYLVGFILFRLFDIIKPWPVSVADEKVHGGLGVMLDDMLAALYPILIYMLLMLETQLLDSYDTIKPIVNFLGGSYVH